MTDQTSEPVTEEMRADIERYAAAAHAMQSGVGMELASDPTSGTPKHLRVGINSAMVENSALARVLMAKGLITQGEYLKALADAMEEEQTRYQDRLSQQFGRKVTLG